jgi:hypothetical protein
MTTTIDRRTFVLGASTLLLGLPGSAQAETAAPLSLTVYKSPT